MRKGVLLVPLTLMLTLAMACDAAEDPSDSGDETAAGDGDSDSGGDICAVQPNSEIVVSETQVDTAYPDAGGGTPVPGVYDMVEFRVYSPATADETTRAERLIVTDSTITAIRSTNGGAIELIGSNYVVSGTNLDFTIECPSTASLQVPFTATETELWLFDPAEPNLKVYTKQ